jgi:large subunit ribosomal protein L30
VSDKTHKTIRIKWVRSGIGFTYHQKTIVRSLGLRRLNQIVVRPDTPQIRGIVAAVPHLLAIVPETPAPAWASVPEYTVHPPEVTLAAPLEPTAEAVGAEAPSEAVTTETAAEQEEPQAAEPLEPAKTAPKKAEKAPAKAAAKKVKRAPAAETKPKAAKKKEAPQKGSKMAKASKK